MDDLKRMAVFASVVQHGSMTGAGRVLGLRADGAELEERRYPLRLRQQRQFPEYSAHATPSGLKLPKAYAEARASPEWPQWEAAMEAELEALRDKTEVRLPKNQPLEWMD